MGALQAITAVVAASQAFATQKTAQQNAQRAAEQSYNLQAAEIATRQEEQEQNAKSNIELVQKEAAERERRRLNLLKTELAKQRAIMGASGTGGGGSAQAVRFGLAKNSDEKALFDYGIDRFQIENIAKNLSSQARRNLFQTESLGLRYNNIYDSLRDDDSLTQKGLAALNKAASVFDKV